MNRPITTLYMLMSLDGKISTGSSDLLDFDKDIPNIAGVNEGLNKCYEIEQTTSYWTFLTGRTMSKAGVGAGCVQACACVYDNNNLDSKLIRKLCKRFVKVVIVTSNANHAANSEQMDNLHVLYQQETDLSEAFEILYEEFDCKVLTLQSGGTMNSLLLREGLIDFVDIVVAPMIVGGKSTPTLVDGEDLTTLEDLQNVRALSLINHYCVGKSYLRLMYKVLD